MFGARDETFDWRSEPAIARLRRSRFYNEKIGRQIDVPINSSPAIIEGMGVVVAGDDGFVRFLSCDLAKVFWERRLAASVYAPLNVDSEARRVLACDTSGLVCAFDLRGKLAWSQQLHLPIFASPAVNGATNSVSIAAFGNAAFGLRLDTGEIRYKVDLPEPWYVQVDSPAARRNPYASPAITADGRSVFCSGSSVIMLSPAGEMLWRRSLHADIKSSPIVVTAENLIAATDVSGRCHFLDIANGDTRNVLSLGAKIVASGAVSDRTIALGCTFGRVWGIDCRARAVLWTCEFGAPRDYSSTTITPLGDFVATTNSGNCVCLAASDGRFLWETSQIMGVPDQSTNMDITPVIDRAGRMYGAGYDGSVFQFSFRPTETSK